MSWIGENAAAISALGSIAMNISTVAIIFFNMHQFKLNRSSLNIEINFRLFEQRKKLYNELVSILEVLHSVHNFNLFTEEKENILHANSRFMNLKVMVDDAEYLFDSDLFMSLCNLLHKLELGIDLEIKIHELKEQDIENWTEQTTEILKELSERSKHLIEEIRLFDVNKITQYLNVSQFNKDFIGGKRFNLAKFSKVLYTAKEKKSVDETKQKQHISF